MKLKTELSPAQENRKAVEMALSSVSRSDSGIFSESIAAMLFDIPPGTNAVIDTGYITSDSYKVGDRQWEVNGNAHELVITEMTRAAEMESRKISYIPERVIRKTARKMLASFLFHGSCTFSNGTTLSRRS